MKCLEQLDLPAFDELDFIDALPVVHEPTYYTFPETVTASETTCTLSVTVAGPETYNGDFCYAQSPFGLCAEEGDNRHIIPYVDLGLQGMLPIIGGGGPWGSVGITGYLDPLADPWYDFLGIGLHWGAGGGIGGELDAGLAVGGMYGESIHSAEGLGGTAGGSGAALHGVSGNVGWSDDLRTWSVDLGYSPGAAAEIHGGRVGYGVVTSGDVVDGVIQTGRDAASAVRETTRPLRSTRGQMWFIWRMTHP